MRVLIIEDEHSVRGLLLKMLHWLEIHDISMVTDGHNAVSLLADPNHNFHLVFLDINMPRMTGDKVFEIIRDITQTFFVVVTGAELKNIKFPPNVLVLQKPFELPQIEDSVKRALKKYKASHHHSPVPLATKIKFH